MYKMLLRDVVSGKKAWYTDCYYNGKVEQNVILYWKGVKYKILEFVWQGYDRKVSPKEEAIYKFVDRALLELDIPDKWREDLLKWKDNNG